MPAETSLSSSQARNTLATTSGAQLATPKSGLLPALPMTDRTSHAYALRQEAKEAKEAKEALLNPIVKQLILDTTLRELAAQSQVAPATKVLTRNENEYAAKTIKEIAAERQARKKVCL